MCLDSESLGFVDGCMKVKECSCHFRIGNLFVGMEKPWRRGFAFDNCYVACFVGVDCDGSRVWRLGMEMVLHFVCRKVVNIVELICCINVDNFSIIGAYTNLRMHSIHNNFTVFNFLGSNYSQNIYIYHYYSSNWDH